MSHKDKDKNITINSDIEHLYQLISEYVRQARSCILKAVNHEQVLAYWNIGRRIVEEEQLGENRAQYGKTLLENLSNRLNQEFGKGFSQTNLKYMRQFYLVYSERIGHKPCDELNSSFNSNWYQLYLKCLWT